MITKFDNLIAELCPGGVEYVKLREVAQISAGGDLPENYEKGQKTPTEQFPYPIYSNGIEDAALYGFTDNYRIEKEAVTISARGTLGYHTVRAGKFTPIVRLITLIADERKIITKFLNYALYIAGIEGVSTGIPSLTVPMLDRFKISLPPLPVQHEIVRILDNFTELTAELAAELTAELAARKKQYNYYRDELLTFGDDVPMVALGEIAEYSKTRIGADELDTENYVGVDNLLTDKQGKTTSNYVPESGIFTRFDAGDVLIGNIRPYLKKIWLSDITGGTNGDVLVVHLTDNKVLPRFLFQLLSSDAFFAFAMQHSRGAKMPRGSKQAIMTYPTPIPPHEEQSRIVAILDRFDTLTTDITNGLTAEIAARQKQYEYYRDKLLSFKEVHHVPS